MRRRKPCRPTRSSVARPASGLGSFMRCMTLYGALLVTSPVACHFGEHRGDREDLPTGLFGEPANR